MIKDKAEIIMKSAQRDVVECGRGLSKVPYEIVSSRSVPQEAVKLIPRSRNHSGGRHEPQKQVKEGVHLLYSTKRT